MRALIILRAWRSPEAKKPETYCLLKVSYVRSPTLPSFHPYVSQTACSLERSQTHQACVSVLTLWQGSWQTVPSVSYHSPPRWPLTSLNLLVLETNLTHSYNQSTIRGRSQRRRTGEAGGHAWARRRESLGTWLVFGETLMGRKTGYPSTFSPFSIIPWEQETHFWKSALACAVVFVKTVISRLQWISWESHGGSRLDQRWIHVQMFKLRFKWLNHKIFGFDSNSRKVDPILEFLRLYSSFLTTHWPKAFPENSGLLAH